MKKYLYLFMLFLCSTILLGCYSRSKYNIYIEDIKIYDQTMSELSTIKLMNFEVDGFLNNFYNSLKPINSPAPNNYYTGLTIKNELNLTIKVFCSVTTGFEVKELSLIDEKNFRNEEYGISPVTIEKVDKDFVLTYLINEIPSSNTFLIFNKSVIVNTSNQIQNAHVTYRGASYNSSYIGIVLKLHSLYIPYINEVNKLNENLTTEFKFQQNLYNIMNDVKSGKDSPYAIHYSVLYNKKQYPVDFEEHDNETYLYKDVTYYMTYFGPYELKEFDYVYMIFVGDPNDSVFGLTINSTSEEIDEVLLSNNFRKEKHKNNQFEIYTYINELGCYKIYFIYSILNKRYLAFRIESMYVFDQYQ